MPKKTTQRELVESYCKQYPHYATLTLAKLIYKENSNLFKDVEHVRSSFINVIRGAKGAEKRKYATSKNPHANDHNNWKPFKEEINTTARILILDIETAPLQAYVWGIWQQNVSLEAIQSDWFIISWAAKWLFEDKVYSGVLTPKEVVKQDDKGIIKGIWELLNKADCVIAHNGQKFDIPKLNSRFLLHKLNPPLPYQQIDTLVHIRRQFGFSSNKLDYVNKLLNLPRKVEHEGMELWCKCMKGDKAALDKMIEYNIGDVRILEDTYLRIRAWIKPHPNLGLHILDEHQHCCPTCGSAEMKEQGKDYHTTANTYELLRCDNCGATSRKRLAKTTIKQKRHLLISSPK